MSAKNIHIKPFDKETITKLKIFEAYAQAWIPTFVMQSSIKEIHIFDFFSGPGYDKAKVAGSPIRILKKIEEQLGNILSKGTKIVLHFNEFEPNKRNQDKFNLLKQNCASFIQQNPKFKYFLTINYYNQDTEQLFFQLLPQIKKYPSLVYLDQNGVKFISDKFIKALDQLTKTDFLYFVSSSYFKRLGNTKEFQKALKVDIKKLQQEEYKNIHRFILNEIKLRLPANSSLKLFPFSLKKNANIYGIIFGSKSYAAVHKFLKIAWKQNTLNGEANYDIDKDKNKAQLDLFEGKKMTKIEQFQSELEDYLLSLQSITNKEVLIHTLQSGHIPKHAVELIKKLKGQEKLSYSGRSPYLTYENVFRKKNITTYKIK